MGSPTAVSSTSGGASAGGGASSTSVSLMWWVLSHSDGEGDFGLEHVDPGHIDQPPVLLPGVVAVLDRAPERDVGTDGLAHLSDEPVDHLLAIGRAHAQDWQGGLIDAEGGLGVEHLGRAADYHCGRIEGLRGLVVDPHRLPQGGLQGCEQPGHRIAAVPAHPNTTGASSAYNASMSASNRPTRTTPISPNRASRR